MRCGSSPRRRSHLSVNMTEGMVIVGGVISAKIPIIPAVQGSSPRRRSHPRGIYRRFTSPRFISATAEITAIRLGAMTLSKAHLRACGGTVWSQLKHPLPKGSSPRVRSHRRLRIKDPSTVGSSPHVRRYLSSSPPDNPKYTKGSSPRVRRYHVPPHSYACHIGLISASSE